MAAGPQPFTFGAVNTSAGETGTLQQALAFAARAVLRDPAAAAAWLKVGESLADPRLDAVELAAYTATAATLLNLDETITRE